MAKMASPPISLVAGTPKLKLAWGTWKYRWEKGHHQVEAAAWVELARVELARVKLGWAELARVEVGWVETAWMEVGWVETAWVEVGQVEAARVEVTEVDHRATTILVWCCCLRNRLAKRTFCYQKPPECRGLFFT
jgi:hypothetical protein